MVVLLACELIMVARKLLIGKWDTQHKRNYLAFLYCGANTDYGNISALNGLFGFLVWWFCFSAWFYRGGDDGLLAGVCGLLKHKPQ